MRLLGCRIEGGAHSEGHASASATSSSVISDGHFTPDASHLENWDNNSLSLNIQCVRADA